MGPLRDPRTYGRFLAAMEVLHAVVLRAAARRLPDEAVSGLAADLDRIARDRADMASGAPEPRQVPHLHLSSEAAAMGALYVTEGARLGATVLRRQAVVALGTSPSWGGRFLAGGGGGARWKDLLDALERAVVTERDVAQAVDGARAAFGVFAWAMHPAEGV